MIIPVAASFQLAKSFRQAAHWSVLFAETAVLNGLAAAYYDWASGGTIVLVSVLLFVLVLAGKRVALRVGRGGERWVDNLSGE
jgi:zinc transport system permease protein